MLYSETQLSAGLLTLPLHFINENPIFSYNVAMITSFFFMGWFMYLLAKRLSKNNEVFSIAAALIFEFAPFRMPAIQHLQNISIFYLPLVFLLIFKYLDKKQPRYLIGLLIALILQFYASWYQMVFVLIALAILLLGLLVFKLEKLKSVLLIGLVIAVASLSTYPLAKSYTEFSKQNKATFSIESQSEFSASFDDYFKPEAGTILGKLVHYVKPTLHIASNDSDSNSYFGLSLLAICVFVLVMAYKLRKKNIDAMKRFKLILIFYLIGIAGFIISFGPLLKIRSGYFYHFTESGLSYVIPMPYLIVDKLLPQLSFIRALGRADVLLLFAMSCLLAVAPLYANKIKFYNRHRFLIFGIVLACLFIELMPLHQVPMRSTSYSYSYNLSVPPVYKFIKNNKKINNIIILSADWDYPGAGLIPVKLPEQILWAGYHNKNIFNGYSGYLPPTYYPDFYDFVDFKPDDVAKLKKDDLRYVMVDKQLSTANPKLSTQVANILGVNNKVYEDKRF
ncbi:MAG TPA: hypothetical protein VLF63_02430, partial [Patescibacteria group bacterium]|nr:hypothetical protein [Patescibacteria group bacterium]